MEMMFRRDDDGKAGEQRLHSGVSRVESGPQVSFFCFVLLAYSFTFFS